MLKIVSAAAGRRDGYQVPIALAEAGLLACHVTDAYAPDRLVPLLKGFGPIGQKILLRHSINLPSHLVHPSSRLALRKVASALVASLLPVFTSDQDSISLSALNQGQRHQASLLLYAGYGYKAFTAENPSARRRGLIQYHPHIRASAAILRADAERHPFIRSALDQLSLDEQDPTNLPELEISDLVICNSSFTAATCRSLGIPDEKLRVIPYGIDPAPIPNQIDIHQPRCTFLFVGTGIHRKGLHHLLLAWKQANLKKSTLTIVSRWIDPDIRTAIDPGEGVKWLSSTTNQELELIYQKSAVLVLPSLVEGFGYVYLEAMARGCFCIGTPNTGLPDFGSSISRSIVPAGDPESLATAICSAENSYLEGRFCRRAIAADATIRSWARFRRDIVKTAISLAH